VIAEVLRRVERLNVAAQNRDINAVDHLADVLITYRPHSRAADPFDQVDPALPGHPVRPNDWLIGWRWEI
jgi:hypothetical protein